MKIQPVHTLNARGNVMLEVMRDYFKLTPERLLREIQGMRSQVASILKKKGVNYDELKAALVPDQEKLEIALVFDASRIENGWYGLEIFQKVIPLLDPKTKNSILTGDYIGDDEKQDILFEAFQEAIYPFRPINYLHSSQFFIVYVNNLTDTAFQRLADGLGEFHGYVGFANTTYSSPFKTFLSTMLVNLCVKSAKTIIQEHEDDRGNDENVNMSGFPFEEHGYKCLSVPSNLFGVLLTYKIERPIYSGFEVDTDFSLNAVTSKVRRLDDFDIQVEEAKLDYLKSYKADSLKFAGLSAVTSEELQGIIRGKMLSSYIYSMSHSNEHNVTKFNIIIEIDGAASGEPFRLLAALEYRPDEDILRLITLY
jgi:hypothetical protein